MSNETPAVPHMTRHEGSKDESIKDNSGTIAKGGDATIHDRTGLYLSIIAALFAALAFGGTLIVPFVYEARMDNLKDRVILAERESRVLQERWNDLKVELTRRGIPVSDH